MTLTGCVARGAAADTFTLAEVKKGAPVAADASTPARSWRSQAQRWT